jgi:aspartate kinase
LDSIVSELGTFANVESVESNQTIVCIVGNFVADKSGVAVRVFEALRQVPIQMISYGGSEHNISILIPSEYKSEALNSLNEGLFVFEGQTV